MFLEKHLRWNDYTKMFYKLKSAKDKESRKYLEVKLKKLEKVMKAKCYSNDFIYLNKSLNTAVSF